ncbi:hypothetical protein K1719_028195 [Acacia pycnantha]|nr:hypothetical protein K1719_028195 [Acacia pycnantha]
MPQVKTYSISFTDFPEDVQLCILPFLTPSEIATFACTSKQFGSLCSNDSELWFSLNRHGALRLFGHQKPYGF